MRPTRAGRIGTGISDGTAGQRSEGKRPIMKRILAAIAALCLASCGGGGGSGGDAPVSQRTEAEGIVDTSFGNGGAAVFAGRGPVNEIVELDDGSLLVGGTGPYIAKLTPNGNLDLSFAMGGIDDVRRTSAAVQRVEKVVPLSPDRFAVIEGHSAACVGSAFSCSVQLFRDVVARRVDARGQPDPTYGTAGLGILPFSQGSLVVSPDGRVTSFTMRPSLAAPSAFGVASLNPGGIRDPAFETRAQDAVQGCAARFTPAGAAVLTVEATRAGSGFIVATEWASGICVTRLNADGSLDPTFANAGFQTFAPPRMMRVFAVFLRSDNGITVVLHKPPNFTPTEVPVFLFLTGAGAKDTALGDGGIQAQPILALTVPDLITLQPNGKVVATQRATPGLDARIARSTATAGAFDGGFGPFRGGYLVMQTPQLPSKVAFSRDGAMLVGGESPAAVVKIR